MSVDKYIEFNGNEYRFLKKMGNSYSSEVYKLASKGTNYVMKISYNQMAYDTEKIILEELQKQNFRAPTIIGETFYNDKNAIIMSFLGGSSAESIVLTPKIVPNMVNTINEFNNMKIDRKGITIYNFDTILDKYKRNIDIIGAYLSSSTYCKIQEQTDYLLELLSKQSYNKLIHRDIRLGNLLIEEEEVYMIDFEGCAIGNAIMDLVKIYYEIKAKDTKMAKFFMNEYLTINCMEKDEVVELLNAYTIVDKINTVVWCVDRNRVGSTFFEKTIYDLRILMKKH